MRHEQKVGKNGEQAARSVLSGLGLVRIQKIGTPVSLIPVRCGGRRDVYQVIWGEKVAGDHVAMMPDGKSVLVEVKTIFDRNLVWSDLREHQPGELDDHACYGISLLVWVHDSGIYVMRWPIAEFRPGKGLTPDRAHAYHLWTVDYITHYVDRCRQETAELEQRL